MLSFRNINQYLKEKLMTLSDDKDDYVSSFLHSKKIEDSLFWSSLSI